MTNGAASTGAKPIASMSLDLDNQWSYMKTHGDAGWESFPSYLDVLVDRIDGFFRARGRPITFFIVGQDAALEKNHGALQKLAAAGHEIGNHSFHHEPWLHRYTKEQLDDELSRAEDAIEQATGRRPVGFRGPGYSVTEEVLRTLKRRGYRYDASTFPTYLGPLARAYYFMTAKLDDAQREERKALFGSVRDGRRSLKPYVWEVEDGLLEIPVTTAPVVKTPFHVSYLLYLSTYSPRAARLYFRAALQACRAARIEPSLLLHPLDFLGGDEVPALAFFPGMQLPGTAKRERVYGYLAEFDELFDVRAVGEHARNLLARGSLPRRALSTLSS